MEGLRVNQHDTTADGDLTKLDDVPQFQRIYCDDQHKKSGLYW